MLATLDQKIVSLHTSLLYSHHQLYVHDFLLAACLARGHAGRIPLRKLMQMRIISQYWQLVVTAGLSTAGPRHIKVCKAT